MFSDREKILLFLTDKILAVYSEDVKLNDRIKFSPKAYSELNLLDKEKFKEQVVELLARTNLKKQKATLALGETAVFMKTGEIKEESDREVLMEQFENAIPFEPDKTAKLEVTDGVLKLIAANKEVYEIVLEAAKIFEWIVEAVVPVSAFGTTEQEATLTPAEVASLLEGSKEIKEANFLGEEPKRKEFLETEKTPKTRYKLLLLSLFIVIILVALFFARSFFNNLKTSGKSTNTFSLQPIALPSTTPSGSPSASGSAQQKETVKIEVLNGTGTPGQASQVKSTFEDLGYSDITVGNAQTNTQVTLLETTASFSAVLRDEIVNALKKDFTNVQLQDLDATQNFDVLVVTGR